MHINKTYFLVGGAGFLGSHFADALLADPETEKVTVFDNLSSGKLSHYAHHLKDPRFLMLKKDVKEKDFLLETMKGHEVVMHFASNPDIARAAKDPMIDFTEGFYLTHQVLEAARINAVKRLIYMSGSGVYGDVGYTETAEDYGPLIPISTYGASKLAGEAFIASYCHMFGLSACVFRFGNIVGPRQTHGVCYDFIRELNKNPMTLTILGDGQQSKSYIYVEDVIQAVFLAHNTQQSPFEIFNVATGDYISVREIAEITIHCMGLSPVTLKFTGGDRGWKGDVPIVRLNINKINHAGFKCQRNSREAIQASVLAMLAMQSTRTLKV